jgi:hypothetical protein
VQVNPALTQDEQTFVDQLIAGLGVYRAYYARMGPTNAAGPVAVDLSTPRAVDPDELATRLAAGEWVVDLRTRTAFAAGRLPGALNFELSNNFLTYLGWLYDWGAPLTLIGRPPSRSPAPAASWCASASTAWPAPPSEHRRTSPRGGSWAPTRSPTSPASRRRWPPTTR